MYYFEFVKPQLVPKWHGGDRVKVIAGFYYHGNMSPGNNGRAIRIWEERIAPECDTTVACLFCPSAERNAPVNMAEFVMIKLKARPL
jgi:hypothetical protein